VGEAGGDEHVRQAGAEHEVALGGLALLGALEHLGRWIELAEKNAALLLSFLGMRLIKPCSANSNSLRSSMEVSQGFLVLSSPPC
jgi:hypothetical protein